MAAEWAYLPEGVLDLIISKLFDQDRYNFRLVCRSWKIAAEITPYAINAPCLIHYDSHKLLWGFFQYNNFFYRSFPKVGEAKILCCRYGWMLMASAEKLFFFNPFNKYTEPIVNIYARNNLRASVHFFHPPTSPNCFIIGITTEGLEERDIIVDIFRYGDDEWDTITFESEHPFLVSNSAPILHHGLVYFVGTKGGVATLNIENHAWTVYPISLGFRKHRSQIIRQFLLKINGDEDTSLYAVFIMHGRETVNVFKLLESEMKWERIKDLGNKMLYLSVKSSFGDVAKPKSMANTICFPIIDSSDNLIYYSLKTQKYHSFDGHYSFDDSFSLTKLYSGGTWITPVPTQQLSTNLVWYDDDDEEKEEGGEEE